MEALAALLHDRDTSFDDIHLCSVEQKSIMPRRGGGGRRDGVGEVASPCEDELS